MPAADYAFAKACTKYHLQHRRVFKFSFNLVCVIVSSWGRCINFVHLARVRVFYERNFQFVSPYGNKIHGFNVANTWLGMEVCMHCSCFLECSLEECTNDSSVCSCRKPSSALYCAVAMGRYFTYMPTHANSCGCRDVPSHDLISCMVCRSLQQNFPVSEIQSSHTFALQE